MITLKRCLLALLLALALTALIAFAAAGSAVIVFLLSLAAL